MKIPRKVKVGAYHYNIKWVNKIKVEGKDCWGLCDPAKNIISLSKDIKNHPVRLKEVFIHECIHAIADSHGFNFSEDTINRLGLAITSWLCDNKLEFTYHATKTKT